MSDGTVERKEYLSTESEFTTEDKPEIKPTDRYNLCLIYIMVFGFTVLLPFKTMTAATEHFQKKLEGNEQLLSIFPSTLNISSSVPKILMHFLNTFYMFRINRSLRFYLSLGFMLVGFVAVIVFSSFDVKDYQVLFFVAIMFLAAILNVLTSIGEVAVFSILAHFPFKYILHFLFGEGVSGILINIINTAIIGSPYSENTATILFFSSAVISIVICLILFFLFTRNNYYKFMMKDALSDSEKNITKKNLSFKETLVKYKHVIRKIYRPVLVIFMTFTVSVLYSPGLILATKSTEIGTDWATKYYKTVAIFLLFNIADTLGREFPRITPFLKGDSVAILVLTAARLLFLPFFLLCNKYDNSLIPNLLNTDAAPIIINFMFGFTNGYYAALAFKTAPSLVEPEDTEYANTFMVFVLGLGLTTGSFFSYAVNLLVKFE